MELKYFLGKSFRLIFSRKGIDMLFLSSPAKLSKEERKWAIIPLLVYFLPIFFVLTYFWFGILMGLNFLPFFMALISLIAAGCIYLGYWDDLGKKYGFGYGFGRYQLAVILLTLFSPAFFFMGIAYGFATANIFGGLGLGLIMVYPILGMFFRIKTFSDDSTLILRGKSILHDNVVLPDGKEFSSGKKEVVETVRGFGFMPLSYWILAVGLGIFTIGYGFSNISTYFSKGVPSLEFIIVTIVLGFLLQTVYLFPDKLNRIVPIELRTKKGFLFMFVLAFVLFGISQFLIGVVTVLTS
ncbi:hypothetical protein [Methanobacterium sp.]|uniref:hypothetical protein n=1 Tax=Methanobacterium sp. TaxID=2164 RepID=UPI0031584A9D